MGTVESTESINFTELFLLTTNSDPSMEYFRSKDVGISVFFFEVPIIESVQFDE